MAATFVGYTLVLLPNIEDIGWSKETDLIPMFAMETSS